jgi:hypothetical protein
MDVESADGEPTPRHQGDRRAPPGSAERQVACGQAAPDHQDVAADRCVGHFDTVGQDESGVAEERPEGVGDRRAAVVGGEDDALGAVHAAGAVVDGGATVGSEHEPGRGHGTDDRTELCVRHQLVHEPGEALGRRQPGAAVRDQPVVAAGGEEREGVGVGVVHRGGAQVGDVLPPEPVVPGGEPATARVEDGQPGCLPVAVERDGAGEAGRTGADHEHLAHRTAEVHARRRAWISRPSIMTATARRPS